MVEQLVTDFGDFVGVIWPLLAMSFGTVLAIAVILGIIEPFRVLLEGDRRR